MRAASVLALSISSFEAATSRSTAAFSRAESTSFSAIRRRLSALTAIDLRNQLKMLPPPIIVLRSSRSGSNSSTEISGSKSETSPSIARIDPCA